MQDTDKEKLRAFEQKMHDLGADGFADGPRPWETWDESGAQAGSSKRVWEGKARRIYKTTQVQRSLGDRVLSGLAMISLTIMVVGIAGVYLTEDQPQSVAWTAVQPTPIPIETAQPLPARVQRPAPVIAAIESLPPAAAGNPAREPDRPAAGKPAGATLSMAATDPAPPGEAAALVETAATTETADDIAQGPAVNESNIEIVTAPDALLLTSSTAAAPDGSNDFSGYSVSEMEMDPELAMEIATAPAIDSDMDDWPGTVTGMTTQESGPDSTLTSSAGYSPMEVATPRATDMINRGTASLASADSGFPETDATPAGFTSAAVTNTAAESSTAADTEPAQLAVSPTDAVTAQAAGSRDMEAMDVTALENLAPTAAGPAETGADADNGNTVVAVAEPEPAAVAPAPVAAAAAPTGDWVVNLASYTYQSTAQRKLALFQSKGVTGEIERIMVNDKPLYRIRVTGFESSRAARASIPALQETLGLEGAWIARR